MSVASNDPLLDPAAALMNFARGNPGSKFVPPYQKANPGMKQPVQPAAVPDPSSPASSSAQPSASPSTGGSSGGGGVTFNPMISPLATQLFFSSAIAPMMQQMAQTLMGENAQFAGAAEKNLSHVQMPDSYRAIFGQAIPKMASNENDVIASLMGAAMSAPALDQLMSQVTAAHQSSLQAYQKMLYQQAQGLLGGSGGGILPADVVPQSTTTPAQTTGG